MTDHRVLVEVIVCPPSNGVQLNEVLKVANLSFDPLVCETRLLKEASRLPDANTIQVRRSQRKNFSVDHVNRLVEKKQTSYNNIGLTFSNASLAIMNVR